MAFENQRKQLIVNSDKKPILTTQLNKAFLQFCKQVGAQPPFTPESLKALGLGSDLLDGEATIFTPDVQRELSAALNQGAAEDDFVIPLLMIAKKLQLDIGADDSFGAFYKEITGKEFKATDYAHKVNALGTSFLTDKTITRKIKDGSITPNQLISLLAAAANTEYEMLDGVENIMALRNAQRGFLQSAQGLKPGSTESIVIKPEMKSLLERMGVVLDSSSPFYNTPDRGVIMDATLDQVIRGQLVPRNVLMEQIPYGDPRRETQQPISDAEFNLIANGSSKDRELSNTGIRVLSHAGKQTTSVLLASLVKERIGLFTQGQGIHAADLTQQEREMLQNVIGRNDVTLEQLFDRTTRYGDFMRQVITPEQEGDPNEVVAIHPETREAITRGVLNGWARGKMETWLGGGSADVGHADYERRRSYLAQALNMGCVIQGAYAETDDQFLRSLLIASSNESLANCHPELATVIRPDSTVIFSAGDFGPYGFTKKDQTVFSSEAHPIRLPLTIVTDKGVWRTSIEYTKENAQFARDPNQKERLLKMAVDQITASEEGKDADLRYVRTENLLIGTNPVFEQVCDQCLERQKDQTNEFGRKPGAPVLAKRTTKESRPCLYRDLESYKKYQKAAQDSIHKWLYIPTKYDKAMMRALTAGAPSLDGFVEEPVPQRRPEGGPPTPRREGGDGGHGDGGDDGGDGGQDGGRGKPKLGKEPQQQQVTVITSLNINNYASEDELIKVLDDPEKPIVAYDYTKPTETPINRADIAIKPEITVPAREVIGYTPGDVERLNYYRSLGCGFTIAQALLNQEKADPKFKVGTADGEIPLEQAVMQCYGGKFTQAFPSKPQTNPPTASIPTLKQMLEAAKTGKQPSAPIARADKVYESDKMPIQAKIFDAYRAAGVEPQVIAAAMLLRGIPMPDTVAEKGDIKYLETLVENSVPVSSADLRGHSLEEVLELIDKGKSIYVHGRDDSPTIDRTLNKQPYEFVTLRDGVDDATKTAINTALAGSPVSEVMTNEQTERMNYFRSIGCSVDIARTLCAHETQNYPGKKIGADDGPSLEEAIMSSELGQKVREFVTAIPDDSLEKEAGVLTLKGLLDYAKNLPQTAVGDMAPEVKAIRDGYDLVEGSAEAALFDSIVANSADAAQAAEKALVLESLMLLSGTPMTDRQASAVATYNQAVKENNAKKEPPPPPPPPQKDPPPRTPDTNDYFSDTGVININSINPSQDITQLLSNVESGAAYFYNPRTNVAKITRVTQSVKLNVTNPKILEITKSDGLTTTSALKRANEFIAQGCSYDIAKALVAMEAKGISIGSQSGQTRIEDAVLLTLGKDSAGKGVTIDDVQTHMRTLISRVPTTNPTASRNNIPEVEQLRQAYIAAHATDTQMALFESQFEGATADKVPALQQQFEAMMFVTNLSMPDTRVVQINYAAKDRQADRCITAETLRTVAIDDLQQSVREHDMHFYNPEYDRAPDRASGGILQNTDTMREYLGEQLHGPGGKPVETRDFVRIKGYVERGCPLPIAIKIAGAEAADKKFVVGTGKGKLSLEQAATLVAGGTLPSMSDLLLRVGQNGNPALVPSAALKEDEYRHLFGSDKDPRVLMFREHLSGVPERDVPAKIEEFETMLFVNGVSVPDRKQITDLNTQMSHASLDRKPEKMITPETMQKMDITQLQTNIESHNLHFFGQGAGDITRPKNPPQFPIDAGVSNIPPNLRSLYASNGVADSLGLPDDAAVEKLNTILRTTGCSLRMAKAIVTGNEDNLNNFLTGKITLEAAIAGCLGIDRAKLPTAETLLNGVDPKKIPQFDPKSKDPVEAAAGRAIEDYRAALKGSGFIRKEDSRISMLRVHLAGAKNPDEVEARLLSFETAMHAVGLTMPDLQIAQALQDAQNAVQDNNPNFEVSLDKIGAYSGVAALKSDIESHRVHFRDVEKHGPVSNEPNPNGVISQNPIAQAELGLSSERIDDVNTLLKMGCSLRMARTIVSMGLVDIEKIKTGETPIQEAISKSLVTPRELLTATELLKQVDPNRAPMLAEGSAAGKAFAQYSKVMSATDPRLAMLRVHLSKADSNVIGDVEDRLLEFETAMHAVGIPMPDVQMADVQRTITEKTNDLDGTRCVNGDRIKGLSLQELRERVDSHELHFHSLNRAVDGEITHSPIGTFVRPDSVQMQTKLGLSQEQIVQANKLMEKGCPSIVARTIVAECDARMFPDVLSGAVSVESALGSVGIKLPKIEEIMAAETPDEPTEKPGLFAGLLAPKRRDQGVKTNGFIARAYEEELGTDPRVEMFRNYVVGRTDREVADRRLGFEAVMYTYGLTMPEVDLEIINTQVQTEINRTPEKMESNRPFVAAQTQDGETDEIEDPNPERTAAKVDALVDVMLHGTVEEFKAALDRNKPPVTVGQPPEPTDDGQGQGE